MPRVRSSGREPRSRTSRHTLTNAYRRAIPLAIVPPLTASSSRSSTDSGGKRSYSCGGPRASELPARHGQTHCKLSRACRPARALSGYRRLWCGPCPLTGVLAERLRGSKRRGCAVSSAVAILAGAASVSGCAGSTRVNPPPATRSETTGATEATSGVSATATSTTTREKTSSSTERAATLSGTSPPVSTSTRGGEPARTCTAERPVVALDPGHSGGPNFDSTAEVDSPEPVTGLGTTFPRERSTSTTPAVPHAHR